MTILVTGARGKTGREVVARLAGADVRQGSSQPGAETPFDWADPDTWPGAVDNADAIYLMRPDVPDAPELVAGLVSEAPDAHVVLLSEQGAGTLPERHWARRVEDAVTTRAGSWTLLRPSWFHQVLTDPRFYGDAIRTDRVLSLSSGGGSIAWVDARDIAAVAVAALRAPAEHHGRAYTLTGPAALSVDAVAAELSARLGHEMRADDPPPQDGPDPWTTDIFADLAERVRTGGFAEVTRAVAEVTGTPPTSMAEFIATHFAPTGPAREPSPRR
ncbi:hypothetical protein [Virgisporangium aurantiacum]|uniref:NmrA family transcriptional regulator n=1 Tax=Virgisporangium aurantiacum TaxID=175570 RepID=A0A8J3ZGH6_9ACTN|nr:hypothetical protein [Virgisporangium aurantiacum]GIJ61175.1 NmrA family transcriptional regulator [Virgisporangium aurantiacum]